MIENRKLLNRVINLAKHTANEALRDAYLDFYARQVIAGDKTEGYEILWEQYQKDEEQYILLEDAVRRMDKTFYIQYYENFFLPRRLCNLDQIISYVKECQGMMEYSEKFDKLLQKAIEKEMRCSSTFSDLWEINQKVKKLAEYIKITADLYAKDCIKIANYRLWNEFKIEEMFDLEDETLYQKCGLSSLKFKEEDKKIYKRAFENIQIVKLLLEQIKLIQFNSDSKMVYELFFTDNIVEDIGIKERIQKNVNQLFLEDANPNSNKGFDFILMCYYKFKQNRFDMLAWAKQIFEYLEIENIRGLIKNSYILNDFHLKKIIEKNIKSELENKSWRMGLASDKKIGHILKVVYSCLTKKEEQIIEASNYSIGRMVVGYLPLFTLVFFFMCLKQYLGFSVIVVILLSIICFLTILLISVLKMKAANYKTFQEYLQNLGIATTEKLITVIGVGVSLILSTVIFGLMLWKLPVLQQEPYYQKTLFGIVGILIYVLIAIIGAIAESLTEE